MGGSWIKRIIVTGDAGLIDPAVVRHVIDISDHKAINLDKLTFAGKLESLWEANKSPICNFEQVDILDPIEVQRVFEEHQPDIVNYSPYRLPEKIIRFTPAHDRRYAIDASQTEVELSRIPRELTETGLRNAVECFFDDKGCCERVQDGSYRLERLRVEA